MSNDNQTICASTSNFTLIFDAALEEYKKLTGKDLHTHPFAAVFDVCNTPEAIMNVYQRQAWAFDTFHKGNDKLMRWLDPTVHILFTLSATLGEGISLVRLSFLPCILLQHVSLSHFLPPRQFLPALVFSSG